GWLPRLNLLIAELTGRLAPSPIMLVDSLIAGTRELYHRNGQRALQRGFPVGPGQRLLFVDHHDAHAWSTYALSGFDDALVLVVDGRGARQATSLHHGRDGVVR